MTPRALGCALLLVSASAAAQTSHASFTVSAARARATKRVAAGFGDQNVVLSDFAMSFVDNEARGLVARPLRTLAIMPQKGAVSFSLSDGSKKNEFTGHARYVALGSGVATSVARRDGCTGSCVLPLAGRAEGLAFGLAGFELRASSGPTKLAQITVQFLSDQSSLRVVFGGKASSRSESRFDVQVRYAWIPNSSIAGFYTVSGEFDKHRTRIERRPGHHLLQGFSLEYTGGERLLHRVSIVGTGKRQFEVSLRDQHGDAAYRARIDYAILK